MNLLGHRHISIAAAIALLAQGATGLLAQNAAAADLLGSPVEETTEVEYGTGWYLRGDISVTTQGNFFSAESSTPIAGTTNQLVRSAEGDTKFTYGLGMGYRFTDAVRADVGYRSLGSGESNQTTKLTTLRSPCTNTFVQQVQIDQFGNPTTVMVGGQTIENCTEQSSTSYNLQALMGNVYFDVEPLFMGIRPFVGLGVGVIRNQFTAINGSVTCTPTSWEQCNPTDGGAPELGEQYEQQGTRNNGTSYHLAGALHAGFAVPLGDDMYFDTSYTYTAMADDATFGGTGGVNDSRAPSDFHSIRLGLRIEIW